MVMDLGLKSDLNMHRAHGGSFRVRIEARQTVRTTLRCTQRARSLGVIAREKADIGVLISFDETTKPMPTEAAEAGFYQSPKARIKSTRYTKTAIVANGHARMRFLLHQKFLGHQGIKTTMDTYGTLSLGARHVNAKLYRT